MNDRADPTDPAPPTGRAFVLAGPSRRRAGDCLPVRGDLAHIAMAGRVFVPHYAAPLRHRVIGAAELRETSKADAPVLAQLEGGAWFDVLDFAGGWAWGVVPSRVSLADERGSADAVWSAVGYVRAAELERMP